MVELFHRSGLTSCVNVEVLLVGELYLCIWKTGSVSVCLPTAKLFNHFNGEDDLRQFTDLLPLLGACRLFIVLEGTLKRLNFVILDLQLCDVIIQ